MIAGTVRYARPISDSQRPLLGDLIRERKLLID
jgi:hypothetical protein